MNMVKHDRRHLAHLDEHEYALLAAFRYALRSFMYFSESAAEGLGLTAQQYQAMLAMRGFPETREVTINDLAQQLLIKHNTTVGLVDRLGKQGLMARRPSRVDGRQVSLRLTAKGERMLERLASVHREELQRIGPQLEQLLHQIGHTIEAPPQLTRRPAKSQLQLAR
jgi:DNA-binding MarR family transcriptional regulator